MKGLNNTPPFKLVIFSSLIIFLIPVASYFYITGLVPSASPDEALHKLEADSQHLLVDINEKSNFDKRHITGSVNWPYSMILSVKNESDIPESFKLKKLFLICDSGISSAPATRHLIKKTGIDTVHISGGIQKWALLKKNNTERFLSLTDSCGNMKFFPCRKIPLFEQLIVTIAAFGLKPLYMIMSFIYMLLLRTGEEDDLRIFFWAMTAFFLGEAFCSVNYLLFNEENVFMEFLHIYGMVMCFSLTIYGVFIALDTRILHISATDRSCSLLPLCKSCYKQNEQNCSIVTLLRFIIPLFFVITLMPLTADTAAISYRGDILGTDYAYIHPVIYQVFEIRTLPLLSASFLAAAFVLILCRDSLFNYALLFTSTGIGLLGFSFFRLIIFGLYRKNLTWFVFWEEVTEFLFMAAVGAVLWLFRDSLKLQIKRSIKNA